MSSMMEDFLQLPDDYESRASEPGKKRPTILNQETHDRVLDLPFDGREFFTNGMDNLLQRCLAALKQVRWADLEEKKDADRKRAIGFVVGQTDWEKITDEGGHLAQRALNRTKYI